MNEQSPCTPDTSAELAWIRQTKTGSRTAFDPLVEAYQRPIYNLCYRMLQDAAEAEDAAQEVFVRAFLKLDSYDEGRKFSTWLFSIASHYCLDRLKRRRLALVSWDNLPANYRPTIDAPPPEAALINAETNAEIHRLLNTLPAEHRLVVILKYWNALSISDMAEMLNTTPSAVKSRLFRARKMMARAAITQPQPTLIAGSAWAMA